MKTQIKWILMVMVTAILSGCGEGSQVKENVPAVPTNTVVNQLGNVGMMSPFSERREGMFDGMGKEQLQMQAGQMNQPYPSTRYWHTRIEFLKEDGSNLDPASVTMPLGMSRVKIILVSDATGAAPVQYTAEGLVYVMSTKGYALTNFNGSPIRVYNPSNTSAPLFDIEFGNSGFGTGPMLGLTWSNFRGSLFGGSIVLKDATGKHIIQY